MGTCCLKSKPNNTHFVGNNVQIYSENDPANFKNLKVVSGAKLSSEEKDERRARAIEAAEKRQQDEKMKGMSHKSIVEAEMKKKRLDDAAKFQKNNHGPDLDWRD